MTTEVVDRLAEAVGGSVRPGRDEDAVGGMPCRWVASPVDTAQVAALLRTAREQGLAVVPRGAGTKLDWGAPPERLDVVLDLSGLDRLVEHAAGDLVTVVGAGRPLSILQSDLGRSGQQLAVDPSRSGTVGGLVATASTGPGRLLHGPVRDLVIGVTCVRADGVVAHSGGKVVKNVAGYDLGKLLTGSFGTLAVLTEVAFRLHPVPEATRFVTVAATSPEQVGALVQTVIHSHVVASACELDRPIGGPATLAVRIDGIPAGVAARTEAAALALGDGARVTDAAPDWWGGEPGAEGDLRVRVSHEVASVPAVLEAVAEAARAVGGTAAVRGSAAVGSMVVALRDRPDPAARAAFVRHLRTAAARVGGAVVVLDADDETRRSVDVWGPVRGLDLMRRVKAQFDPGGVLSPGRFVGGI